MESLDTLTNWKLKKKKEKEKRLTYGKLKKKKKTRKEVAFLRDYGVGNPRITQVFRFLAHRSLSLSLSAKSDRRSSQLASWITITELEESLIQLQKEGSFFGLSDYLWQDFSWTWMVIINPTLTLRLYFLYWDFTDTGKKKTTEMLNLP